MEGKGQWFSTGNAFASHPLGVVGSAREHFWLSGLGGKSRGCWCPGSTDQLCSSLQCTDQLRTEVSRPRCQWCLHSQTMASRLAGASLVVVCVFFLINPSSMVLRRNPARAGFLWTKIHTCRYDWYLHKALEKSVRYWRCLQALGSKHGPLVCVDFHMTNAGTARQQSSRAGCRHAAWPSRLRWRNSDLRKQRSTRMWREARKSR